MNENIDLTRILKDCPKGWKFWSPIFGEIEFCSITENVNYPIILSCKKGTIWFSKEGLFDIENEGAECVLFPSKDQRDWNKFTAPWYKKTEWFNPWRKKDKKEKFDPNTLKPFDKVLVKLSNDDVWIADFFSYYDKLEKYMKYVCATHLAVFCIPYNDDTKHLLGTNEEAPEYYRYWED